MGQHAILSASASKRWMNCTPSALLEKQFADEESIYAAEGTAAHALAEHKLKRFLKKRSKRPVSDYDCDEMEECIDDYVSFAMEQIEKAKQSCSDPVVMIEQRLDFSRWVPEGFGTGDLVIVADDTLYIVDLKYGKGIGLVTLEEVRKRHCCICRMESTDAFIFFGSIGTVRFPV